MHKHITSFGYYKDGKLILDISHFYSNHSVYDATVRY